jgi:hypothetical protein
LQNTLEFYWPRRMKIRKSTIVNRLRNMAIVLCVLALSASGRAEQEKAVNVLKINLSSDKRVYSVGDKIHFKIAFINHMKKAFRILELTQFQGNEFLVQDAQGKTIGLEGGLFTYSPKVGVFTGTTRLIPSGQRYVLKLDALVDFKRRLNFADHHSSTPDFVDAAFKEKSGLPRDYPDDYIGTGRIFPLAKPGKYRLRFVYEGVLHWKIVSPKEENDRINRELWIGKSLSNEIEIEIR